MYCTVIPVYSGRIIFSHRPDTQLTSMQAAQRLVRHRALRRSVRCLATTANGANAANSGVHVTSYTSTASSSAIPLSNVEAQWEKMTSDEQLSVHQQLEELQKKDWKELSLDEKKAGLYLLLSHTSFWKRGGRNSGDILMFLLVAKQLTMWLSDPTDHEPRRVHLEAG